MAEGGGLGAKTEREDVSMEFYSWIAFVFGVSLAVYQIGWDRGYRRGREVGKKECGHKGYPSIH